MKKSKMVTVELRVPPQLVEFVVALAKQGLLGNTPEEVIRHMLRQHLFDVAQAQIRKQEPPCPKA